MFVFAVAALRYSGLLVGHKLKSWACASGIEWHDCSVLCRLPSLVLSLWSAALTAKNGCRVAAHRCRLFSGDAAGLVGKVCFRYYASCRSIHRARADMALH